MRRVLAILACGVVLACASGPPRVLYAATVRLASDEKVSREQLHEISLRLERAFEFALQENRWTHPQRVRSFSLEVEVSSTLGKGVAASAHGPETMKISVGTLGLAKLDGIIAHELSHVQDLRVLGDRALEVPRYLHEGKALWIGHAYRMTRNEPADDAERAKLLGGLTAAQATEALAKFRIGADQQRAREKKLLGRYMSVGVFFVEFLRTKLNGGGVADAVPRLARTYEAVGAGKGVGEAFEAEFGVSLADAEKAFVAFLAASEDKPQDRLAGTIYAQYAP